MNLNLRTVGLPTPDIVNDTNELLAVKYEGIMGKASAVMKAWGNHSLSLLSKALVLNTLVIALFAYKMSVLPVIPKVTRTRMHSSGMRTARLGCLCVCVPARGGTCLVGGYLPRGWCTWRGVPTGDVPTQGEVYLPAGCTFLGVPGRGRYT